MERQDSSAPMVPDHLVFGLSYEEVRFNIAMLGDPALYAEFYPPEPERQDPPPAGNIIKATTAPR